MANTSKAAPTAPAHLKGDWWRDASCAVRIRALRLQMRRWSLAALQREADAVAVDLDHLYERRKRMVTASFELDDRSYLTGRGLHRDLLRLARDIDRARRRLSAVTLELQRRA